MEKQNYRNKVARFRIILYTTYICLHINVEDAAFLLRAPNLDLKFPELAIKKSVTKNYI